MRPPRLPLREELNWKLFTACHLPLPRNGLVILYILNASFPFGQLFPRTSLISGKAFNAHLKFVFHFLGSGISRPSLYLSVYKAHAWNRAASSMLQPRRLPCFHGTRKVPFFGSPTHLKPYFPSLIFCTSQSRNRSFFLWCIVWRRQWAINDKMPLLQVIVHQSNIDYLPILRKLAAQAGLSVGHTVLCYPRDIKSLSTNLSINVGHMGVHLSCNQSLNHSSKQCISVKLWNKVALHIRARDPCMTRNESLCE